MKRKRLNGASVEVASRPSRLQRRTGVAMSRADRRRAGLSYRCGALRSSPIEGDRLSSVETRLRRGLRSAFRHRRSAPVSPVAGVLRLDGGARRPPLAVAPFAQLVEIAAGRESLRAVHSDRFPGEPAHRGVENGLHWALDVDMNEGRACNGCDNGPRNLAIFKHMASMRLAPSPPNSQSAAK